jgi:hypothetical protein
MLALIKDTKMTTKNTPALQRKNFASGFDCGNGAIKLAIDSHDVIRFPSYLITYTPESTTKFDHSLVGCVQYIDGDFPDLKGYTWIAGESAHRCDSRHMTRNVDDVWSKSEKSFHYLLSGLAHLPHRKHWDLKIVASTHDSRIHTERLQDKLHGSHKVMLSGQVSEVNIQLVKVLEEGQAALAGKGISQEFRTVLDIGNGTALVRRFRKLAMESNDKFDGAGVEALIKSISQSEALNKILGKNGDTHLIRQALESGKLEYRDGINTHKIKDIYAAELKQWFGCELKPAMDKCHQAIAQGDYVLVIGGGSQLPGIAKQLKSSGFVFSDSGCTDNVLGLLSVAQSAVKKETK